MRFTKVKYFLEKTAKTKKYLSKTIILPTHHHLRQQKKVWPPPSAVRPII